MDESSDLSLSEGFSDSDFEDPGMQTICSLCHVKLNIPGVHHTRSSSCMKCRKVICINCLSKRAVYKLSETKICKFCGHQEMLLSSDCSEIDEINQEIASLKLLITKKSSEKKTMALANQEISLIIQKTKDSSKLPQLTQELTALQSTTRALESNQDYLRSSLLTTQAKIAKTQQDLILSQQYFESLTILYSGEYLQESSLKRMIKVYELDSIHILNTLVPKPSTSLSALKSRNTHILSLKLQLQAEVSSLTELCSKFESLITKLPRRPSYTIVNNQCGSCILI